MYSTFKHYIGVIFDTLFPHTCAGCGTSGTVLCRGCEGILETAHHAPHPWIHAPFSYHDKAIQKIVRVIKSRNHEPTFAWAAAHCHDSVIEITHEHALYSSPLRWILVPIPISRTRNRERGFNQALELARHIKNFSVKELLIKNESHKGSKQALTKNRNERLRNVKGSFGVKNFQGDTDAIGIILIDDVTTTGATLAGARKVLKKAGFKTIHAVAFAFQPLVG